jgi:hypothetical protein
MRAWARLFSMQIYAELLLCGAGAMAVGVFGAFMRNKKD